MGRKKSVDKTTDLEAEVLKATRKGRPAPASAAEIKDSREVSLEPATGVPPISPAKIKTRKKTREKIRSKKYTRVSQDLDGSKLYDLNSAIALCQKNSLSEFDGSLELHLTLGLDIKDDAQKLRTNVSLPHGTGKVVKVMAFVSADKVETTRKAGADFIGTEKTIEEIINKDRAIDFDKVVATPDFMSKLAQIAKILGPKGLMPSPKTGTVSLEPEKAVAQLKKGRLEIKMDPQAPIIHTVVGKLSFPASSLVENFRAIVSVIQEAKPAKAGPGFIESAFLCPTMGPSVKLDLTPFK